MSLHSRAMRAANTFRDDPGTETGVAYATALIEAAGDNEIGNDTFRTGMIAIAQRLTGGRDDMGGKVEVTTKAI